MNMKDYLRTVKGFDWNKHVLSALEYQLLSDYNLEAIEKMASDEPDFVITSLEAIAIYQCHKVEIWQITDPTQHCDAEWVDLFEARLAYAAIRTIAKKVMNWVKLPNEG